MLSVSRSTITSYETGLRNPDVFILIKIADIFDVSIDYLMGRTNFEKKACSYFQTIDDEVLKLITSIDLDKNSKDILIDHLRFAKEQIYKHSSVVEHE